MILDFIPEEYKKAYKKRLIKELNLKPDLEAKVDMFFCKKLEDYE